MTGETRIRIGDLAAGPVHRVLSPDSGERQALARRLGLEALDSLEAELDIRAWMDGCEVAGRFKGDVVQVCGVSLEPFSQPVSGEIQVRLVPPGSPSLPVDEGDGEVEISLETPDPPEVLDGDVVDLGELLEEHLALAIDPFPRKPGVVFEWEAGPDPTSPFAALRTLKDSGE